MSALPFYACVVFEQRNSHSVWYHLFSGLSALDVRDSIARHLENMRKTGATEIVKGTGNIYEDNKFVTARWQELTCI